MTEFLRKLGWSIRRRDKEAELREELEFHLSEEAAEREEAGLSGAEARRAARRGTGNLALIEEKTRATWGGAGLRQLLQDLRYAVRTKRANPLFTALAVSSLALGIGANTAIYSFMDAILFRSLPVRDPESLVVLNWRAKKANQRDFVMHGISGSTYDAPNDGMVGGIFPYPAYEEIFRKSDAVFSAVFAHFHTRRGGFVARHRLPLFRRGSALEDGQSQRPLLPYPPGISRVSPV